MMQKAQKELLIYMIKSILIKKNSPFLLNLKRKNYFNLDFKWFK